MSGSSALTRLTSSLRSGWRGATARRPPPRSASAASSESRRSLIFLFAASGPWQAQHLSESMGRMSRLKSIRRGDEFCALALSGPLAPTTANPISASRADSFKRRMTNSRHCATRPEPAPSTTVMIHIDPLRIAANLEARASGGAVGIFDMNAGALRAHGFEIVAAQPLAIVIDAGQLRLLSPVFSPIKDGIFLDRLRLWVV